uniref:Inositol-1-monophosphatase n=1 Tax=Anopheles marajoara TaxID=58244 RepID=A0A2M4BUZ7_9DIPT
MCDDGEIKKAFEVVLELVKQCNDIVLEGYRTASKRVEVKGKHWDLVTEYDQRVEDVLIAGIRAHFPHHKFCAEELASATGEQVTVGEAGAPTWIIDPIDGTVNFVRGIQFTCISVALAVDGELKIGIISNPAGNELYTAVKGQGAFRNGVRIKTRNSEQVRRSIRQRYMVRNGVRIKTRNSEQLKDALIGHEFSIGSYEPIREALFERGKRFIIECLGLRAFGSAALSLAYIASGQIDAYSIQFLKPWDIAAGALLIMEAGGTVQSITGGKYDIMKPDIIAACSEALGQRVLQIIREVDNDLQASK